MTGEIHQNPGNAETLFLFRVPDDEIESMGRDKLDELLRLSAMPNGLPLLFEALYMMATGSKMDRKQIGDGVIDAEFEDVQEQD